jgi:hypothetical protein
MEKGTEGLHWGTWALNGIGREWAGTSIVLALLHCDIHSFYIFCIKHSSIMTRRSIASFRTQTSELIFFFLPYIGIKKHYLVFILLLFRVFYSYIDIR